MRVGSGTRGSTRATISGWTRRNSSGSRASMLPSPRGSSRGRTARRVGGEGVPLNTQNTGVGRTETRKAGASGVPPSAPPVPGASNRGREYSSSRQPTPSQQHQARANSLPASLGRAPDDDLSPANRTSTLERETVRAKKDLLDRARRPLPSDREDDCDSPLQTLQQRKERREEQLRDLMRNVNTAAQQLRSDGPRREDAPPGRPADTARAADRQELESKIREKQTSWAREHWRQQHDQQRQTRYKELLALFRKRRAREGDGRTELGSFLADLARTESQLRDAQRRRSQANDYTTPRRAAPAPAGSDWPRPAAQPQRPRSATAGGRVSHELFGELRREEMRMNGDATARGRARESDDIPFRSVSRATPAFRTNSAGAEDEVWGHAPVQGGRPLAEEDSGSEDEVEVEESVGADEEDSASSMSLSLGSARESPASSKPAKDSEHQQWGHPSR
eukprot:Hpha_TRINITY_DN15730_c3_g1::TRINITY_DN15730_c3_g1_i3::g.38111::m.38111